MIGAVIFKYIWTSACQIYSLTTNTMFKTPHFYNRDKLKGNIYVIMILKIQIWVDSGEKSCPQLKQRKIIRARFLYNLAVSLFRSNMLWLGLASLCYVTVWISKSPFFWTLHSVQVKWKSLSHVRLFVIPWNSPGQNSGVGSLSLLLGIFPTQGSNPGLPHYRQIFYQLSHKGSPILSKN